MITTTTDAARQLTIHTCSGRTTIEQIRGAISKFYAGAPTANILWDFSDADLSQVPRRDIRKLAEDVRSIAHSRAGGKTAIVAHTELEFGLGRMYQIFGEIARQIATIEVFKTRSDAEQWLAD